MRRQHAAENRWSSPSSARSPTAASIAWDSRLDSHSDSVIPSPHAFGSRETVTWMISPDRVLSWPLSGTVSLKLSGTLHAYRIDLSHSVSPGSYPPRVLGSIAPPRQTQMLKKECRG